MIAKKIMDLELISKILKALILENDRVSLPGMGSFIAEMAPSVFSDRARVIHPPFRRILFRPSEIWNDQLLEKEYAANKGVSEEEARRDISELVKSLKSELNVAKSVRIPEFGTMRATEQNDYFFVADKDLFNYTETFGLKPVNVKLMPKRGQVEELTGKPVPNFFHKESHDPLIREIQHGRLLTPTVHEPVIEDVVLSQPDIEPDIQPVIQPVIQPESQPMDSQPVEKQHIDLQFDEPESADSQPVQIEEVVQTKEVSHSAHSQTDESQPLVSEHRPASKPARYSEIVSPKNDESKKSDSGKFVKRVIMILGIIFTVIVVIVLLYVFKDELRPFWEWILYNKEERELLRSAGSSY
jgi:nucleoid DNA-binding protein